MNEDEYERKIRKYIVIPIKIIGVIAALLFLDLFIFTFIGNGEEIEQYFNKIEENIYLFPIFFVILIMYWIIVGYIIGKKRSNSIMSTKQMRQFKYLDSFYYSKEERFGSDTGLSLDYFVYHIIQDISTKKIYAIHEQDTDARFYQDSDNNTKLLKKDKEEVNYNDVGLFWIDYELTDWYQNIGDEIIINYLGKKIEIKNNNQFLKNRNPKYDISLLDKVTFISGIAKFDMKNLD